MEIILVSGKYIQKEKQNTEFHFYEYGDMSYPFQYQQEVIHPEKGTTKKSFSVSHKEYDYWLTEEYSKFMTVYPQIHGNMHFPKTYQIETRGSDKYIIPLEDFKNIRFVGYIKHEHVMEGIWLGEYRQELLLSN